MKSLDISIYLQTEWGMCPDCLSSLLDGFVIYLSFMLFSLANECGSKSVSVSVCEVMCMRAGGWASGRVSGCVSEQMCMRANVCE